MPAATSSTRPTSTPRVRARRSSAADRGGRGPRPDGAHQQVHQQRRLRRPERRRQRPQAHDPCARGVAAPPAAPTTSTCTCCTPGTGSPRSKRSCAPSTTWSRAGKIRYAGLSDVPAWYAARAQTLRRGARADPDGQPAAAVLAGRADDRGRVRRRWPRPLGIGITAWSPLGGGLLSGKYRRTDQGLAGDGPADGDPGAPVRRRPTGDWAATSTPLETVADELGVHAWRRWRSTGWPPNPASPR